MAESRIRKDAVKLDRWDPILLWYARGVAVMRARPLNDPTSWRYQAAIHDYIRQIDPLATPGDVLPSTAEQQRFWRQCQHSTWFFLPWHRMYLSCFERIVAAAVVSLGGPDDWALPYWNYSPDEADARRIPRAFRDAQTPDGVPNPLRVTNRNPGVNNGGVVADDDEVDIEVCLSEPSFVARSTGGNPGFGGPRTLFNHGGGSVGFLEQTPHGDVHVAVGGWMGRFNTAGLDPLFWLHHANIDRLWTVWQGRDPLHADPADAQWLTGVSFDFHDETGAAVTMTCDQVMDTTAEPLLYEYDDVSDPLAAGDTRGPRRGAEMADEAPIPEMVGATDQPIVLTGRTASASVPVTAPAGPGRSRGAAAAPGRVYLNIENITGNGEPTSYAVYVNLPPDADPAQHRDLFAGILPMFGVAEASRPDAAHPGSGLQVLARGQQGGSHARGAERLGPRDCPRHVRAQAAQRRLGIVARRRGGRSDPGRARQRLLRVSLAHPLRRAPAEPFTARLERFRWRHPEWWTIAISALAWAPIVLDAGKGHATRDAAALHHGAHAAAAAPSSSWTLAAAAWLVMIAAMMLPLLVDAIRTAAARSLWTRRDRAIGLFLAGYAAPWVLTGAGVVVAAVAFAPVSPRWAAAAFVAAAIWQLTPIKKRALLSCHRTMPLAPRGWRADRDCLRYGWSVGRHCVMSCGVMMTACVLASHGLVAMAGVTAIAAVERRMPRLSPRVTASALVALGAFLLL